MNMSGHFEQYFEPITRYDLAKTNLASDHDEPLTCPVNQIKDLYFSRLTPPWISHFVGT